MRGKLIGPFLAGIFSVSGTASVSATFAEVIKDPRSYLHKEKTFTEGVVVFRAEHKEMTVLVVEEYWKDEHGEIKFPTPTGKDGAPGLEQVIPVKLVCRLDEQVCGMTGETKPEVGDLITVDARVVRLTVEEKDKTKRDIILLEARTVRKEGAVPLEASNFWTLVDAILRSAGGGLLPYAVALAPIIAAAAIPSCP